jgi:hypothetical protein
MLLQAIKEAGIEINAKSVYEHVREPKLPITLTYRVYNLSFPG